ncbi:MAG: biopolymer transporter ExbD, partial [Bryobacterales bacterium]|nr:biopolymer transporter ExbD [Bryobacterales bacterium]
RTVRNTSEELPVVTLTKDGEVYLAEKPVNVNNLVAAIKQKYPGQEGVYIRADKNVIWEPMAQVISVLGDGKLAVRMVTQPIEDSPRRGR